MTYRQEISPENARKFKQAVHKTAAEIDRTKLGYIGLVGTSVSERKPVHDLDVLIFPSIQAKVGEAILAMNNFYSSLDARLCTDNSLYLATCPRRILQPEVNHIMGQIKGREKKISTHTLFFPDYEKFIMFNPVGFLESIAQCSETVVGDFNVIKQRKQRDLLKMEPYFMIADFQIPLVTDKYPQELTLEKTEFIINYLAKIHGFNIKGKLPNNPRDCAKIIEEVLLELDKRN